MHSLQKQFHDYIHANQLIRQGEHVLVAVSGGLDSMVLAHLLVVEGVKLSLAHCNFGLRGAESDGDEALVMEWADRNGVNCYVKSFDLGEESIQLAARNARYGWFRDLAKEYSLNKVATAHHLNDSLETILINICRGTGIKGLSGIVPQNNNIIRPLLFAEKSQLLNYAMDEGLVWREDTSNFKTDYDRNLIRHEVIPVLERVNPSVARTFFHTSERLRLTSDLLDNRVEEVKSEHLVKDQAGWRLDLHWIGHPSDELVLSEILKTFGMNYLTSKEVFEARRKSGKTFPTGDFIMALDRGVLFINESHEYRISPITIGCEGIYDVGKRIFKFEKIDTDRVVFGSRNEAYFDMGKLGFPLTIRPWKEGDRIHPLGMKGSKKVSDLLIDEKVPVHLKGDVLVAEAGGAIAWVVGYRVGEKFKITKDTKEVLKIIVDPEQ